MKEDKEQAREGVVHGEGLHHGWTRWRVAQLRRPSRGQIGYWRTGDGPLSFLRPSFMPGKPEGLGAKALRSGRSMRAHPAMHTSATIAELPGDGLPILLRAAPGGAECSIWFLFAQLGTLVRTGLP
jgi:hypothetical protein